MSPTFDEYFAMDKDTLKLKCRARELKYGGNKTQLAERLVTYDEEQPDSHPAQKRPRLTMPLPPSFKTPTIPPPSSVASTTPSVLSASTSISAESSRTITPLPSYASSSGQTPSLLSSTSASRSQTPASSSSKSTKHSVFGAYSVLGTIDLEQERPVGTSRFDWCTEQYFKCLWMNILSDEQYPSEVQEYFRKEPYSVMVSHAIQMFHQSVKDVVNSGIYPNAQAMTTIGRALLTDDDGANGGGYSCLVPSSIQNALWEAYAGSANHLTRRKGEHTDPVTWQRQAQNKLYQALASGRPSIWNGMFEFPRTFAFEDEWSLLRQKLLESLHNALFVFYGSSDWKRVRPEVQIAEIAWTELSLKTRDEFEAFELMRGFRATNKSIPYAEEIWNYVDPFKYCFDGVTAAYMSERGGDAFQKIRVGSFGRAYDFNLSDAQKADLSRNKVKYGTFQAHQTSDGSLHPNQYVGVNADETDPEYDYAGNVAFSFTYKPLTASGTRTSDPVTIWLTTAPIHGPRRIQLYRAYFVLSIVEHAYGLKPSGPKRFPLSRKSDEKELKVWQQAKKAVATEEEWDWVPDIVDQCIDGDCLTCPWCGKRFEHAHTPSIKAAWACHLRDNSSACKSLCLKSLDFADEDISGFLTTPCHCGVEFASEQSKEIHLRAEDGLDCLLKENKLLSIMGEDLLATELKQMCRYCGTTVAKNVEKHYAAVKSRSCLIQHNADMLATGRIPYTPPTCRECKQTTASDADLTTHLMKATNRACFDAENEFREEHSQPMLELVLFWCQETVCAKDTKTVPDARRAAPEVVDKGPDFRFSTPNSAHMTTHYSWCHPGVEKPKPKDTKQQPQREI